jgi:hypothetical protein
MGRHIRIGEHSFYTRYRQRWGGVDGDDTRMRMWAPQDRGVPQMWQFDVIHVRRVAGEKPGILPTPNRSAYVFLCHRMLSIVPSTSVVPSMQAIVRASPNRVNPNEAIRFIAIADRE